jgi:hypothetical protein
MDLRDNPNSRFKFAVRPNDHGTVRLLFILLMERNSALRQDFRSSNVLKVSPSSLRFAKGEFQGFREILWGSFKTRITGGHEQNSMALRLLIDEIA